MKNLKFLITSLSFCCISCQQPWNIQQISCFLFFFFLDGETWGTWESWSSDVSQRSSRPTSTTRPYRKHKNLFAKCEDNVDSLSDTFRFSPVYVGHSFSFFFFFTSWWPSSNPYIFGQLPPSVSVWKCFWRPIFVPLCCCGWELSSRQERIWTFCFLSLYISFH